MTALAHLAVAYATAFVINVIPAFMPSTWLVLAFFYIHYKLPLLLVTIGGAVFASLGRLVLALATRRWGRKIVPAKDRTELDGLGTWLDQRPSWQVPVAVLVYSLGPFPSNQLFIAAGLTRTRLAPVVAGYFVGRVVSFTVSAAATSRAADSLESILRNYWNSPRGVVIQIVSFAALIAFTMIPWRKVLHIPDPTVTQGTQSQGAETAQRPRAF